MIINRNSYKNNSKERFAAIGELSTRIAHDIRNPLAILKNHVSILQNSNSSNKIDKSLQSMNLAIKKIDHQITNVLSYVQPRSLTLTKFRLSDVLNEFQVDSQIKLDIHIDPVDIVILGDHDQISNLFYNLIMNAQQAISGEGTISVHVTARGDNINIQIKDTGEGIPKENLENIFNPLFTTKESGTGLGLVNCKHIVQEHGGTISVTSDLGVGTTFIVNLPKEASSSSFMPLNNMLFLEKIKQLQPRDHLAFEFDSYDEISEYISEFIILGMKKNFLNILVLSSEEIKIYESMLRENLINVDALVESNDLIIISHDEVYENVKFGGSFDPIVVILEKMAKLASEKKKNGLNIVGTIAGTLASNKQDTDTIKIENGWHEIIPNFKMPIILICPYQSSLDPSMRKSLVENHSKGLTIDTISKKTP